MAVLRTAGPEQLTSQHSHGFAGDQESAISVRSRHIDPDRRHSSLMRLRWPFVEEIEDHFQECAPLVVASIAMPGLTETTLRTLEAAPAALLRG
jgi:hypothetical protein